MCAHGTQSSAHSTTQGMMLEAPNMHSSFLGPIMSMAEQAGTKRLSQQSPDWYTCSIQCRQCDRPQLHTAAHLQRGMAMVPAGILCHGPTMGGEAHQC